MWVDPSGYKSHSNKNIDYGELDELGRPTGVKATIDADMIKTGTKANQSIKPPGFGGGGPNSPGHARGHLLGINLVVQVMKLEILLHYIKIQ